MVGDIKKGRFLYFRCTGNKGVVHKPYVRSEVLEEQFVQARGRLRCASEAMDLLVKEVKGNAEVERAEHEAAIQRYQAEHTRLDQRLRVAYLDRVDGRIDSATYDQLAAGWRAEQDRI